MPNPAAAADFEKIPVRIAVQSLTPEPLMQILRTLVPKFLACVAIPAFAAIAPASAATHQLNRDELVLIKKISTSSAQRREPVWWDPILCKVARARAADMMKRHYFSHTSPSGKAANYLVGDAGYVLPSYYSSSRSGNNIESIGMSTGTPKEMFSSWLKSKGHRPHLLGEMEFYRQQTSIGVGVVRSPDKPHYKYYVFLSAPPNAAVSPRLITLRDPGGTTVASTRPLASAMASLLGTDD